MTTPSLLQISLSLSLSLFYIYPYFSFLFLPFLFVLKKKKRKEKRKKIWSCIYYLFSFLLLKSCFLGPPSCCGADGILPDHAPIVRLLLEPPPTPWRHWSFRCSTNCRFPMAADDFPKGGFREQRHNRNFIRRHRPGFTSNCFFFNSKFNGLSIIYDLPIFRGLSCSIWCTIVWIPSSFVWVILIGFRHLVLVD